MFRKKLAVPAMRSATVRVFLWTRRPGSAKVAPRPSHAEFGNSTPADTSGDAQPTIHSGGIALSATAAVVFHGRRPCQRVQHRIQGSARTAEAASQIRTAPM